MAKKEKLEALVPPEEQPYPVPENWRWVYLVGLADVIMGQSPEGSATTDDSNYIPLIGGAADMGDEYPKATRYTKVPTKLSTENDIIVCIRATLGRPIYSDGEYCLGRGVAAIRPQVGTRVFFKWLLVNFEQYLYDNATGSTFAQVSSDTLRRMPVPCPPLTEQQRIVDRIESLFAKLDEAKEKAQAVVDGFEDRKAAILHKAFTGELTEQWRKEKNLSLDQWQYVKWGSFLKSIEAGKNWNALGRPPEGDEFGVVKVSAVTWGEFEEKESKTCTEQSQWNDRIQIKLGDFLFSRANTIQLVGNCVIVRDVHKRLMLSDKILRFNMSSLVDPEYILFFTRSDLYRNQIEELASGNQDGMRNVSQANLKKIEFPIPSKEEQLQIVKLLSNFHNKANISKQVAKKVIDDIDGMKKSILAKAFRGELGTNDPAEPPVELPQ